MDYLPKDAGLFAAGDRGRFYLATSGLQGDPGPSEHGEKAVLTIEYDFERNRVVGRPREFMRYRGDGYQYPVDAAVGPDGLYVVPLRPVGGDEGPGAILKITHNVEASHPFVLGRAKELMRQKGCTGCHRDAPNAPAPALEPIKLTQRLMRRLSSETYERRSRRLDERDEPPFERYEEARRKIRQAEGIEKVRLWIKHRLLHPRFDDPDAQMPDLGLSEQEARVLTDHLVRKPPDRGPIAATRELVVSYIPNPRLRHLAYFGIAGFLAGSLCTAAATGALTLLKRRRKRS